MFTKHMLIENQMVVDVSTDMGVSDKTITTAFVSPEDMADAILARKIKLESNGMTVDFVAAATPNKQFLAMSLYRGNIRYESVFAYQTEETDDACFEPVVAEQTPSPKFIMEVPAVQETPAPVRPTVNIPDGTYTLVGPQFKGGYRTVRVKTCKFGSDVKTKLEYLAGPDNTSDFIACAFIDPISGRIQTWKRFRSDAFEHEMKEVSLVLRHDPRKASKAYALRSGKCGLCGRELTVPESIEQGMGPVCAAKVGWA